MDDVRGVGGGGGIIVIVMSMAMASAGIPDVAESPDSHFQQLAIR